MSNNITDYLDIPEDFQHDFDNCDIEYIADTGSSGDMVYSYYFIVPEHMSEDLLSYMGWRVGDEITDIPPHIFESG
jgi:hypothetical protein